MLTIGPLAYGVGYFKAAKEAAVQIQDCQGRLNSYMSSEADRIQMSSSDLATQIEEFKGVQEDVLQGIKDSANREWRTQEKLKGFENAIRELEIPNCVADGVGGELRKLAED